MDELDNIKKLLKESNTRNKQYGQSVPENYFENLEENILSTYNQSEITSEYKGRRTLLSRIIKISSIAAAVAILFLSLNYFYEAPTDSFVELVDSDIETEYFLESENLYTEDFLELEGIDEVLDELEEQLLK